MPAYILLIEDDPVQQKVAEVYVNRYKAFKKYTSFNKARSALRFIYDSRLEPQSLPDIILLDLNMPEFSGWDFLDALKPILDGIRKEIDIYILSSSIDPADQARAVSYPIVKGFYTKPISKSIIEDISGKVLKAP